MAAAGHLSRLEAGGTLVPFARGARGYRTALGPEPYLTVVTTEAKTAAGCAFGRDTVFALEPAQHPGVIRIGPHGQVRRFADLPSTVQPDGIAYDAQGRFGHRLVVTAAENGGTTVFAVGCGGGVTELATHDPAMEGGIAVAPASFGRFAGDLIAPSEGSGRVFAIKPDGSAVLLVESHLPSGGDIGVESAGFVPSGFGPAGTAYLADRFSAGNRHPGTDSVLTIPGTELARAGVRPGDLLVASEGGAKTIAVRCQNRCTVRHIADGPGVAHGEGHIAFALSAF